MRAIHPFARISVVSVIAALLVAGLVMFYAPRAHAHCDGLDGPVVTAARAALDSGEINRILIWVQPQHADEIQQAFADARAMRKLGPQAREFADRYFFETLVRIHRAGENAPYTGLKPAGRDLGPAIPAADKALETGSDAALVKLITAKVEEGLRAHFKDAQAKKQFKPDDIAAGREYVEAYVTYIHYVERLYEAAEKTSSGHYDETQ
ncbi:MAG TPA: DUF6448 family protein [Stellaceae bacterium]|nr:DUF6448 family protein [Stellaceae bacterium]